MSKAPDILCIHTQGTAVDQVNRAHSPQEPNGPCAPEARRLIRTKFLCRPLTGWAVLGKVIVLVWESEVLSPVSLTSSNSGGGFFFLYYNPLLRD